MQEGDHAQQRLAATLRRLIGMSRVGEGELNTTLVGNLVFLWKSLQEAGGELRIFGVRPHLQRVLAITMLDERIPSHASEQETLEAFGSERRGATSRRS